MVPGEPVPAATPATVEGARQSLEAALQALRELQAAEHHAERLVREALELVRQLPQSSAAPQPTTHESPLLSVVEVAELLGLSRRQAAQMAREGTIPSFKLGQRRVVPRTALKEWEEAIETQGLG